MVLSSPDHTDLREKRRVLIRIWIAAVLMLASVVIGLMSWLRNEASVLIVTSSPPGAEVVLNNRPTYVHTNAYMSGLPADSFIVTLRMDGYRPVPHELSLRLDAGDTTRITFFLAPIAQGDDRELPRSDGLPYKWQWRYVRMNSEPPGAELVIDDVRTGLLTPANAIFEHGLHHLQAHWPNGAKAYKNLLISPESSQPDVMFRAATYIQPNQ